MIDGAQAPWDPLQQKWNRERLATRGDAQPIWSNVWSWDATLPHEATLDWDWFFSRFVSPGPHVVVIPAPGTEALTIYSGVAFAICEAEHQEIQGWFMGPKIRFEHIMISGGVPL
jgi:hypothetical protein